MIPDIEMTCGELNVALENVCLYDYAEKCLCMCAYCDTFDCSNESLKTINKGSGAACWGNEDKCNADTCCEAPPPTWRHVGFGGCTGGNWKKIGTANNLE